MSNNDPLQCDHCKKYFSSQRALTNHLYRTADCLDALTALAPESVAARREEVDWFGIEDSKMPDEPTDWFAEPGDSPPTGNGDELDPPSRRKRTYHPSSQGNPSKKERRNHLASDHHPPSDGSDDSGYLDIFAEPEPNDDNDDINDNTGNGDDSNPPPSPDYLMNQDFKEYCEGAHVEYADLTEEEEVGIKLLNILKQQKAPLKAYDAILHWHLVSSKKIRDDQKISDALDDDPSCRSFKTREAMMTFLKDRYNMEKKFPRQDIPLLLPYSKYSFRPVYHDLMHCIQSLLTDPRVKDSDYMFFNPDDPFAPPPDDLDFIADFNTGSAYIKTHQELIGPNPGNRILMGLPLYIDSATTGQFRNLPVTPLKIGNGLLNRVARDKPYAWRTIGYLSEVPKDLGKGYSFVLNTGHISSAEIGNTDFSAYYRAGTEDVFNDTIYRRNSVGMIKTTGKNWEDAKRYQNDSFSVPIVKAQDLHMMLYFLLEELNLLNAAGGFKFDFRYNGKLYRDTHFVTFVPFIKCDTEEADKLCGRYTSRSQGVQSLCRTCDIPGKGTGDPCYRLAPEGSKLPDYQQRADTVAAQKRAGDAAKKAAKAVAKAEQAKAKARKSGERKDNEKAIEWENKAKDLEEIAETEAETAASMVVALAKMPKYYHFKDAKFIFELVKNQQLDILKTLSQQPILNAFDETSFGLHNRRGIHGACPAEMLHFLLLGLFLYTRESFFLKLGGKESQYSKEINGLSILYGQHYKRQSRRDLPRTNFKKGIVEGKLMGHEYSGVLLLMLTILCCSGAQDLLFGVNEKKGHHHFRHHNNVRDWIEILELMLQWQAWLRQPKIPKDEVIRARDGKHRKIMSLMKKVLAREKGMGFDLFKFHAITHLAEDMLMFGVPMELDNMSNEQHHKPSKVAAKLTQKKPDTFIFQTALRLVEFFVIELGMEEIAGRPLWEYHNGWDHHGSDPTTDNTHHTNNNTHHTDNNTHNTDDNTNHHTDDNNNNNEIHTGQLGGSMIRSYPVPDAMDHDLEEGATQWRVTNQKIKDAWMDTDVSELLDCLSILVSSHDMDHLPVYTSYTREGIIFRAHPNYMDDGPWRDWVNIEWEGEETPIPAQIMCFIDLTELPAGQTLIYGKGKDKDQICGPGIYAVVESTRYVNWRRGHPSSNMFVPIEKETIKSKDGLVTNRKLYLADVEAFHSPIAVIPDIGSDNKCRYFMLKPKEDWIAMFTEFLYESNEDSDNEFDDNDSDDSDSDSDNDDGSDGFVDGGGSDGFVDGGGSDDIPSGDSNDSSSSSSSHETVDIESSSSDDTDDT